MIVRALLAAALALVVVGCGGNDDATTPVRVYFLRDGNVWPVARDVESDRAEAASLEALLAGPTKREATELGATTEIAEGAELEDIAINGNTAIVKLSTHLPPQALAQVVYTATQFPNVRFVSAPCCAPALTVYSRRDFEAETPQILVESPLPFEEVTTPLRVTGTANTFEATFDYELKDSQGKVVDSNFVTATSGTGTRGTFDFTTKAVGDVASVVVFERSAKDGSRINEVEIPVRPAH